MIYVYVTAECFQKQTFFMQLSSITMDILFAFIFDPSALLKAWTVGCLQWCFHKLLYESEQFLSSSYLMFAAFPMPESKNKPPDLSQPCPVHLQSWEVKCCSRAGGSEPWSNYPADSSVPHSDGIICLQLTMLQQHNRTEKRDATTGWEEEGVISR